MAIEYLSGNRATGTSSDRTGLTTYSAKSWVELGRATLSSAGDTLDLTGLDTSDYPYIKILATVQPSTGGSDETYINWRFNNDSGNNYAFRYNSDGGSDGTNTSQNKMLSYPPTNNQWQFITMDLSNKSNQEKLAVIQTVCRGATAGGSGNAPSRRDIVGKWVNTSSAITQVTAVNSQTSQGDFQVGTEFVVLGAKSSGTNTDKAGFWQELADLELSSAGDTLDTSTITAKKYLWIQAFIPEGAGHHGYIYFNGDDGGSNNNYARRGSINGGNDITTTDDDEINWSHDTNTAKYLNMFVINKSDKEKLCIAEYMDYGSSGAGTAPNRIEWVYKWVNTSAQISSVKLYNNKASSNDFPIGTTLKVWGSD